jgi:hypothetical protein
MQLRRILWALAVVAALSAVGALAAKHERRPMVAVATTGNDSELVKTLGITRDPGARKEVVISLGPGPMPDLARGDRVRVTAELQVTGNCASKDPRCRGPIYHYNPRVRARLVLAPDAHTTSGPQAAPISDVERETCSQRRPQYEHHCVLVFTRAGFRVGHPRRLPCAPEKCHVNLVADVHHPRADEGDLLMVGGLRPDGSIPQDRGRINAVRYRDASPPSFQTVRATEPLERRIPPDFRRRVVFSAPLEGLERAEQLSVSARMLADVSSVPYAVRTSARLILARSPEATTQGSYVKRHARLKGEISENNGSNCTQPEGRCATRKVGVLEMRRDAVDRQGREVALYVNLVAVMGPKVRKADQPDRVRIRGGGIEAVRFPPAVNG